MKGAVASDRVYRFDASPPELWAAIARVDDYRCWWPWLRRFEAHGLVEGDRWRCAVRPPLPYVLHFTITITAGAALQRIDAEVSGDIAGTATVGVRAVPGGSELRLTSTLRADRHPLRVVARLLPHVARYGHDWVLDTGWRQFRERAFGG